MAVNSNDLVADVWDVARSCEPDRKGAPEDFLETAESKSLGDKGRGDESTGHRWGRRIVQM